MNVSTFSAENWVFPDLQNIQPKKKGGKEGRSVIINQNQ